MSSSFADFVAKSAVIGGDAQAASEIAAAGFAALRDFLVTVSTSKKPADSDIPPLLANMVRALPAGGALLERVC